MMRRIAAVTLVSAGLLAAGCNTVKGAGEDVSSAGKAVSTTAEKSK